MRSNGFKIGCVMSCAMGMNAVCFAQTDLTRVWDNGDPNDNNWTSADNWDPDTGGGGPMNVTGVRFFVDIPDGFFVVYDKAGDSEITSLDLGNNATLRLDTVGANLTVIDTAGLAGIIDARGGNFTATSNPDTNAELGIDFIEPVEPATNRARIFVSDGSQVSIDATGTYSSVGLGPEVTFFNVTGEGSILNLPNLMTLDTQIVLSGGARWHQILADDGGQVNMPSLKTVHGPLSNERMFFTVRNGGAMDLTGLEEVFSASDDTGHTTFLADGEPIALPKLVTAQRTVFDVRDGAVVDVDALASYSSVGLGPEVTFFNVTGEGSILNLPNLMTLDTQIVLSGGARWHQILADDGGQVNMPSLKTVHGPLSNERMFFTVRNGGAMDLTGLEEVFSASDDTGHTTFLADGEPIALPKLVTAQRTVFDVRDGAVVDVDALASYSSVGLGPEVTFFNVTGEGSILNLPNLMTLDTQIVLSGGARWHQILADDGGQVNMPSLKTVHGPLSNERMFFTVRNGGAMDLSTLDQITSEDSGNVNFVLSDGGKLLVGDVVADAVTSFTLDSSHAMLGGLRAVRDVGISLSNASTMQIENDLVTQAGGSISLNSETDRLEIGGSLVLESNAIALTAAAGSNVTIGGDFLYGHSEPNDVQLGESIATFDGSGIQKIEAGGTDVNIFTDILPDFNFGIGQLVVGTMDQATTLRIIDAQINVGGGPEALYLWGLDDGNGSRGDGLVFQSGSMLDLGYANVYVFVDDEWVFLNGLGDTSVTREEPFLGGTLLIPGPRNPGDANEDGKVDAVDLNILALNWQKMVMDGWAEADFNGDMLVDASDLNVIALNWQMGVTLPTSESFDDAFAFALATAVAETPEPGSVLVLGLLGAPLAWSRRRRMN